MTYAKGTYVAVERSQREIEELLAGRGATGFIRGQFEGRAVVAFQMKDRRIQFEIPLPNPAEFQHVERRGHRYKATEQQIEYAVDQSSREKWRALALAIKAKLVSVESGVETFEEAFLAHIVIPGGKRYASVALPQLAEAYKTGKLPPLLPSGGP